MTVKVTDHSVLRLRQSSGLVDWTWWQCADWLRKRVAEGIMRGTAQQQGDGCLAIPASTFYADLRLVVKRDNRDLIVLTVTERATA